MDPLAAKVVEALVIELAKSGGKHLSTIATRLLNTLRSQFQGNAKASECLNDFENDPNTYKQPLTKEINNAIIADSQFRSSLQLILKDYRTNEESSSISTYANVSGQGNQVAQASGFGNTIKQAGGNFIEQATIFGIPAALITAFGSGVMLFGFFAMPWVTMLLSLTGFEMVNQLTNPGFSSRSPSWQVYSFWLIPSVAIFAAIIALVNLNSKGRDEPGNWYLVLFGGVVSLYPFYYLYSDFSSGLGQAGLGGLTSSVISSGFWISLAGNVMLLVSQEM